MSDAARLAVDGGSPVRTAGWPRWPAVSEELWENSVGPRLKQVFLSGVEGLPNPTARAFEERWCQDNDVAHAVLCSHGTDALQCAVAGAMDADGLGYAGEVICPNYTFIASAGAPLALQTGICLVDVDPDDFNLSVDAVAAAIGPKTAGIMAVHLGGHPAHMDALRALADKHHLALIEDCAQAHGAEHNGRPVGGLGDCAGFSFQSSKNLTSGEGGLVTSQSTEVYHRAYAYLNIGRYLGGERWSHPRLGWNYRSNEYMAALLLARLETLEDEAARRDDNGRYLNEQLAGIEGFRPPKRQEYCTRHAYHLYMSRYDPAGFGGRPRSEFLAALGAEGIPCSAGYDRLLSDQDGLRMVAEKYPRPLPCRAVPDHRTHPRRQRLVLPEHAVGVAQRHGRHCHGGGEDSESVAKLNAMSWRAGRLALVLLLALGAARGSDERLPTLVWAFRQQNVVLAPARPLLDWLHLSYKWDQSAGKLLIIGQREGSETRVEMALHSTEGLVNGHELKLGAPPLIELGMLFVPLRPVADAFGVGIWFQNSPGLARLRDGARGALVPVAPDWTNGAESLLQVPGADPVFSGDSHWVATERQGKVAVTEIAKGEIAAVVPGLMPVFSRDGRWFAVLGQGKVNLHETATGRLLTALAGSEMRFLADGRLAVWSLRGPTRLCDLPGGAPSANFEGGRPMFSADGKRVATVGDKDITVYEIATGKVLARVEGIYADFSPDGRWLATLTANYRVRLWVLPTGAPAPDVPGQFLSFCPDSRWFVTWHEDGPTQLFALPGAQGGPTLDNDSPFFGPDGRVLATRAAKGFTRLRWLPSGKPFAQLEDWIAWFTPDGRMLATGVKKQVTRLYSGITGKLIDQLEGEALAVSPDGEIVATGGPQGPVNLWRPTVKPPEAPGRKRGQS